MSESFVIPLGVAGLTKADFGLRYYLDGVADATVATAATVTEVSGDYLVGGLPDGAVGQWHTVTWEYPAGVGGFHVWPLETQSDAPPNFVIPVKETGLVAADFSFALYKDGALQVDVISATEIGSPGDYRVSGWPSDEGGVWMLVWRRHGLSFYLSWSVLATEVSYLHITPRDRPFEIGLDDDERVEYAANFDAIAVAPVTTWLDTVAARIIAQGAAAALGTDIWIGRKAVLPDGGDGPYVRVIDSGGAQPIYEHQQNGAVYERLSVQVVVTARSEAAAEARALDVWRALDGVRNTKIAA